MNVRARQDSGAVVNALTVDVEEYFQVGAFEGRIARDHWDRLPSRLEENVDRVLAALSDAGIHGTFFTLGWIAERYPVLVRRIVAEGHEVASHGYDHKRATAQAYGQFLADVRLAKAILEDITGVTVLGYRAPSFSIGGDNTWAFQAIAEAGYRYSSSLYPIRHDHYGVPDAPRFPFAPHPGLLEIPATTVRLLFRNWPAAGGGYFRLLPYPVSRWMLRRVNEVERKPAMFYFHPWELDTFQPRVGGLRFKSRFRHYLNLDKFESRLRRLFSDFRWDRADRVFLPSGEHAVEPYALPFLVDARAEPVESRAA